MSFYEVTAAVIMGGLQLRKYAGGTAQTPDGDGLITLTRGEGMVVTITGGSTVNGFRVIDARGDTIEIEPGYMFLMMLRSSDASPVTLVHESLAVDATYRIAVDDGASTAADRKLVFFAYDSDDQRWLVADWAGV